ncbi:PEPxxWA-CTERM sorting domain-containing protein [Sphingomonas sp.]|jgi:hypothetical protein|uniref:PEPxxWA-CTERM sorting domain-containing protein n=1 Tax=Sphingomonas sp. TaxID=28214 RepID=UPI002DF2A259|nr:PEPxxWA-CTERM sorting domain-containing protein [Sphingomonas sp.]
MSVKFLLAATAIALAAPVSPLTITERFGTLAPKDTPLPSIVSPVGTFTGAAGSPFANVFIASPGYNNSGPGNNPTTSSILVANGDESFDVTLAFAARSISMDVYLNDLGPATVTLFNGNATVASFTFLADASPANKFSTVSFSSTLTQVTRFTFVSTNGGSLNTGLDNVSITAVPEPASWAMMIGGFAFAGAALRRRPRPVLA